MSQPVHLASFDQLLEGLRAIAEPTRLRLALLLRETELTVTEICQVVGQSQPRISRHLRLLVDGHLLERSPEGAFVFYRVADRDGAELVRVLAEVCPLDDAVIAGDLSALERVREARSRAAAAYLETHASDLAAVSELAVADADVEQAIVDAIADETPIERLVDIGTGTGRILELLAPYSVSSVGLDISRDMLALARANISEAGLAHASVRQGDLHRPPLEEASFDVAVMHQVLNLLDDPAEALADAARLLRPNGRLLIVDFAPHDVELLRERHGHRHLGIADEELIQWAGDAGLAVELARTLHPSAGEQRLSVSIWRLRLQPHNDAKEAGAHGLVSLV